MISAPFWFARNFFTPAFYHRFICFQRFWCDRSKFAWTSWSWAGPRSAWVVVLSKLSLDGFSEFLVQVADQPGWIWFPGSVTICCSMIALYGSMALWFYGSMVLWLKYDCTMIALWFYGSMILWFYGSMVEVWLHYDCTMIVLWLHYDCTMVKLCIMISWSCDAGSDCTCPETGDWFPTSVAGYEFLVLCC